MSPNVATNCRGTQCSRPGVERCGACRRRHGTLRVYPCEHELCASCFKIAIGRLCGACAQDVDARDTFEHVLVANGINAAVALETPPAVVNGGTTIVVLVGVIMAISLFFAHFAVADDVRVRAYLQTLRPYVSTHLVGPLARAAGHICARTRVALCSVLAHFPTNTSVACRHVS